MKASSPQFPHSLFTCFNPLKYAGAGNFVRSSLSLSATFDRTHFDKSMVWVNYNASVVLIRLLLGALNSLLVTKKITLPLN